MRIHAPAGSERIPRVEGAQSWPARVATVAVYALAMGYVEAAAVIYLRQLFTTFGALSSLQTMGRIEAGREAATMVMLATIALLADRRWRRWLAYFALAFGVWDIAYYLFYHLLVGWPSGLGSWDELFLLPVPWFGPVWAPMVVSLVLIAFGLRVLASLPPLRSWQWAALGLGAVLAYLSFTVQFHPGRGLTGAGTSPDFLWPPFVLGAAVALVALGAGIRRESGA